MLKIKKLLLLSTIASAVAASGYLAWHYAPRSYPGIVIASDAKPGDWFGSSTATLGERVLVGSFYSDVGANDTGSGYLFTHGQNGLQETKLLPAGEAGDIFGFSAALNTTHAVLGAVGGFDRPPPPRSKGQVAIFNLSDSAVSPSPVHLRAPDGQAGDNFGFSVSLAADLLVVGAKGHDASGENSGAVYVYEFRNEHWTLSTKLVPPIDSAGDQFGTHVSTDGVTIAIGAPFDDDTETDSGAVYIATKLNDSWKLAQKIKAAQTVENDYFGVGVDVKQGRMIVGASHWKADGRIGTAYLFDNPVAGEPWQQSATLRPSDGQPGDMFGFRVALSGDYSAISAHLADSGASDSGAVYVYDLSGEPRLASKLTPAVARNGDAFGVALAISGTYLVVGAETADTKGVDSGGVYFYETKQLPTN